MSSNYDVQITIRGANLSDAAFKALIADLEKTGATAGRVTTTLEGLNAAGRGVGGGLGNAAQQYRALANELQTAAQRAELARRAFDDATRSIGGNANLARGIFPGLARELDDANLRFGQLQTQARSTVGALGGVGTAAQGMGSSFRAAASQIGSIATGIFSAVQMSQMFIMTAGNVVMSVIRMQASMEQTSVAFKQLLGSQSEATKLIDQLRAFNKESPFDFPQIAQAARQMLAYGSAAKDIVPQMRAIGDAVAALGGGTAEVQLAIRALGQMSAAGRITAQDMNQLAALGINGYKILAEQMGLTTAQVRAMGEQGKLLASDALPLLYAGFEKNFGGGMAAQALTFNGILSNVRDTLGQVLLVATKPMFDDLKRGLQSFYDYTQTDAFTEMTDRWGKNLVTLNDGLREFVVTNGPGMLSMLGDIATLAGETAVTLGKLAASLQTVTAAKPAMRPADVFDLTTYPGAVDKVLNQTQTGANLLGTAINREAAAFLTRDIGQANQAWGEFFAFMKDGLTQEQRDTFALDKALQTLNATTSDSQRAAQRYAEGLRETIAATDRSAKAQEMAAQAQAKASATAAANARALFAMNQGITGTTEAVAGASQMMREYGVSTAAAVVALLKAEQSIMAITNAQEGLSSAYQSGLSGMKAFVSQGNEYGTLLKQLTNGYELFQQKQASGVALTEREQQFMTRYPALFARLTSGQADATGQAALFAGASTEVMLAQDSLNEAIIRGEKNLKPYQEALSNARALTGDSAFADPMKSSLDTLSNTVISVLAPALDNLSRKLEYIAQPWLAQIDVATGAATTELNRIIGLIAQINASNVAPYMPGLGDIQAGGALPRYGDGGMVTRPTLAIIGEKGPEYIIPANEMGGAERYMMNGNSDTGNVHGAQGYMAFISSLVGQLSTASGELGGAVDSAKTFSDSASSAVTLIGSALDLLQRLADASAQYGPGIADSIGALSAMTEQIVRSIGDSAASMSSEFVTGMQTYADAASSGLGAMTAAMDFSRAMGDQIFLYGDWQARNIDALKRIAEQATVATADSAAYLGDAVTGITAYADAATASLSLLSSTIDTITAITAAGDLSSRDLGGISAIATQLAGVARTIADAVASAASTWDTTINPGLDAFSTAVGSSVSAMTATLDLLSALRDAADSATTAEATIAQLAPGLSAAARVIGDAFAAAAAGWGDQANPAMAALSSNVGDASSALRATLDLLTSLRDTTDATTLATGDISAQASGLSANARVIADAFAASAATWTTTTTPVIQDLGTAVSASTSAFGSVLDTLATLGDGTFRADLSSAALTTLAERLAGQARIIATAFQTEARQWDTTVTPAMEDFNTAVSASTSALGATLTLLTNLGGAAFSMSDARLQEMASRLSAAAVLFAREVESASTIMGSDAMAAAGAWATNAQQVMQLFSSTADAMVKIADVSAISKRQTAIFTENFRVILELIRQLKADAAPYMQDAADFQAMVAVIAADIQAAAAAIQTIAPSASAASSGGGRTGTAIDRAGGGRDGLGAPGSAGGGGGGGSGGGGGRQDAPLASSVDSIVSSMLGFRTSANLLSTAIQAAATTKFGSQVGATGTLADELLGVTSMLQQQVATPSPALLAQLQQAMRGELGDLGLTGPQAVGQTILSGMGLTPEALKKLGFTPDAISELQRAIGTDQRSEIGTLQQIYGSLMDILRELRAANAPAGGGGGGGGGSGGGGGAPPLGLRLGETGLVGVGVSRGGLNVWDPVNGVTPRIHPRDEPRGVPPPAVDQLSANDIRQAIRDGMRDAMSGVLG